MSDRILVVGGGLGGLAAALALSRVGRATTVFESATQFGEIGAGIQMAPNAFYCFDALGIREQATAGAVFVDEMVLMDAMGGERIASIPLKESFRKRFGNPYAVIHRADLHTALLEACRASDKVELRPATRVIGYEQDGRSATAILESGERVTGAALIGADGLHSAIRRKLVADGAPRIAGHTTYRSVIPTEKMPEDLRWNAATLWAGEKCHLVHYPLKGWKVFNLVVTTQNDVKEPVAGKPVSKEEMRGSFEHIHPKARQIVEHGEDWKLWVLCDREPVANWVDGRALLLGDAAHPMLQYFAQGACMAIEDAVCLATMLDQAAGDFDRAFAAYNRHRAPRTGRVQLGSRLIGEYVYHPSGARAAIRNASLGSKTPEQHYEALAWLYEKQSWSLT